MREQGDKKPALDIHGTTHFWSESETAAYVEWINTQLKDDPDLASKIPVSKKGTALFESCQDGILLVKLINRSVANTIDERLINKKPKSPIHMSENLQKVLVAAKQIGCQVHNLGPEDIKAAVPHLCLGLIWQVIKIGLLSKVVFDTSPRQSTFNDSNSKKTSGGNSTANHEKVLLEWMNNVLEKAGCTRKSSNFGNDLADSVCLSFLVHYISPPEIAIHFDLKANIADDDLERRAEVMLEAAGRLGCRQFASSVDIVAGNKNLNMAFVAILFNAQLELAAMAKRTAAMADSEENLRKAVNDKEELLRNMTEVKESTINTLQESIRELEQQLEKLKLELFRTNKENDKKYEENLRLKEFINLLQMSVQKAEAEINSLSNSNEILDSKVKMLHSELKILEEQIEKMLAENAITRQEKELAQNENIKLNSQIQCLQISAERAEADLNSTAGAQNLTILQIREAHASAEVASAKLRAHNTNLETNLISLHKELEIARKGFSLTETSLRNEIKGAQDMLEQKNNEINR
ncbi:phospholipid scramblase 1 [Nowakowskiella sp. JEL0078]|nr:phospholipid scramblase 1 [Nowakowskiella sp. JEL0078]